MNAIARLACWAGLALGQAGGFSSALAQPAMAAEANGEGKAQKAPLISVVRTGRLTFIDRILVTGSLTAREEVLVGPEIDGYRVTEILAEDGDEVQQGQVLARLSSETLQAHRAQNAAAAAKARAAIDQVRNQIAETEATLRQAEDAFSRVKHLRQSGVASQAQFDEREAAYQAMKARLAAQKEGLRLAEADELMIKAQGQELEVKLRQTAITAPAAGIISRRTARLGALSSSAAEPLFRIIKGSEIELDAEVPEFYMARLKAGQPVRVEIEGVPDRTGTIRLVSSEVSPTSRLGRVRIFLGKSRDLKPGAFAKGEIDAGRREAVGVPATAVLYQNDTAAVFVIVDNKVRLRKVRTGILVGDRVEIKEGLKAGEVVVMRAGSLLRDGDVISAHFPDQQTAAKDILAEVR